MKKLMASVLALLLLCGGALAEFNNEELERTENCIVMMQPGTWEKLICPMNQPSGANWQMGGWMCRSTSSRRSGWI